VRRFFKALVPATIGSAGTQLALFADTIIASFLAAARDLGAVLCRPHRSTADRRDRHCGRHGAGAGDDAADRRRRRRRRASAQNRAIEFALLLAVPCIVAFLVVPEVIMRGLFMRGRFTAEDAHAAAMTLMAYTIGLIPFVLIRSVVAPFLARGDTLTPMKAALTGNRGQYRLQGRADGRAGAGRAGAGDLDRRLDQFRPGAVARSARRTHRIGRAGPDEI
jgi:putative peptidoglycan lipid II flippase